MTLKVNFTEQEATSQPREVPPSGEYLVNIVEATDEVVKPGRKNSGKPYWKLRMVVQDGPYSGSTIYGSVMLFDTALYSLAQLMRSLDQDVNSGEFEIPETDWLNGKSLIVRGFKRPPSSDSGQDLPERFEVKAYKPAKGGVKASANSSLLP